ncbi:hypothetical protein EYZ11_013240 [Aspergillus tanneri]|uniref:YggT family protein n=1 Tax=Aspergillus tanneri TaxID=1220188 RepID=A0A4S3IY83_9EURO|nr:hypothetical protein EYZ11_013240 [Aspergillus tanneri]
MAGPATPFQVEVWIEYGIGVLILLLRIFARLMTTRFGIWDGDDYFTILVLLFWTAQSLWI